MPVLLFTVAALKGLPRTGSSTGAGMEKSKFLDASPRLFSKTSRAELYPARRLGRSFNRGYN